MDITTTTVVTIEKEWDGNEGVREGRNGRTYVSAGRWQWLVLVNGEPDSAHDRKREAKQRAEEIKETLQPCAD